MPEGKTYPINRQALYEWVEYHRTHCGHMDQAIIESDLLWQSGERHRLLQDILEVVQKHLRHVSWMEFVTVFEKQVALWVEDLASSPGSWVLYIDDKSFHASRNKSYVWLSLRFIEHLRTHASDVLRHCQGIVNTVGLQRSKGLRYVVLVDDMIYSGAQLQHRLDAVASSISGCQVQVVVPFSTTVAHARFAGVQVSQRPLRMYTEPPIPVLIDLLPIPDRTTRRKYHKLLMSFGRICNLNNALVYFDFKVADFVSIPVNIVLDTQTSNLCPRPGVEGNQRMTSLVKGCDWTDRDPTNGTDQFSSCAPTFYKDPGPVLS